MGIVRGPLKSVTAAAPPGASGKNEPHHIATAATTNLLPDFYNKIGTELPTSALQRFRSESEGQLTFGGRDREDRS
jgi:hypothetical protein